jgi:tellurite methyltransferase
VDLIDRFGEIDVYLFDQLLRGRIRPGARVLDAGCGSGRNLVYLRGEASIAVGVDRDRGTAADALAAVGALPFPDASFDAVICVAVLHFAADEAEFHATLDELWRVLAPGGLFFARLASDIGIEDRVQRLDGRRARIPDGTERFLVDEAFLLEAGERLGAELVDPIKTTNVQSLRAMTTWVLRKPA